MITVERTSDVDKPIDTFAAHLKDSAHVEQRDPGTRSCVRRSGGSVEAETSWLG